MSVRAAHRERITDLKVSVSLHQHMRERERERECSLEGVRAEDDLRTLFVSSLCAAMEDQLHTQAFRTLVQHVAAGSAIGGASWPPHPIRDVSHALTDLMNFISDDIPCEAASHSGSTKPKEWVMEQWVMDFGYNLLYNPKASWTVTHIWLEWKHFLTPPTWAFADRSAYTTWRGACAPKLALSIEERDALRSCEEVYASCYQDSAEEGRIVTALIEEAISDEHRSEAAWWTAGCPPSSSPYFPSNPHTSAAFAAIWRREMAPWRQVVDAEEFPGASGSSEDN